MTTKYHLICIPASESVEKEVNRLLEQYEKDYESAQVGNFTFATAPYYRKGAETKCPKCRQDMRFNPHNLNGGAQCETCGLKYSQEEVSANTTVTFAPGGTFFIVSFFVELGEKRKT